MTGFKKRHVPAIPLLLAAVTGFAVVPAEEAQQAAPKEPFRVESPERHQPITITIEDLEELQLQLEQIRREQAFARTGVTARAAGTEADPDAGPQRTIVIEAPRIVHLGTGFLFVDATLRGGGPSDTSALTLQQRRAAVEALIRSMVEQRETD